MYCFGGEFIGWTKALALDIFNVQNNFMLINQKFEGYIILIKIPGENSGTRTKRNLKEKLHSN